MGSIPSFPPLDRACLNNDHTQCMCTNKTCYSYGDCLTYFWDLFRKHYGEGFFLNKQEVLHHDLIALCESSPAVFWACLQEQRLVSSSYRKIRQKIRSYLVRREPIPYINGKCFFFGMPFRIRKGVFIPQPDTEVLVKVVLLLSKKICSLREKVRVLEIGCGSGNIAITLAKLKSSWKVLATDISKKALTLARENAFLLEVPNVQFLLSNQFSGVTAKFHILTVNPPYVSPSSYNSLNELTKKQPRRALLSADNGYFFYRSIIRKASSFLRGKFLVAFEIGDCQSEEVIKIIPEYFPTVEIETSSDFNGKIRVVAFYQQ